LGERSPARRWGSAWRCGAARPPAEGERRLAGAQVRRRPRPPAARGAHDRVDLFVARDGRVATRQAQSPAGACTPWLRAGARANGAPAPPSAPPPARPQAVQAQLQRCELLVKIKQYDSARMQLREGAFKTLRMDLAYLGQEMDRLVTQQARGAPPAAAAAAAPHKRARARQGG
jgi:hypothetical protein